MLQRSVALKIVVAIKEVLLTGRNLICKCNRLPTKLGSSREIEKSSSYQGLEENSRQLR